VVAVVVQHPQVVGLAQVTQDHRIMLAVALLS
jgi:hypothetical protein